MAVYHSSQYGTSKDEWRSVSIFFLSTLRALKMLFAEAEVLYTPIWYL
jgi:hypothetical protein